MSSIRVTFIAHRQIKPTSGTVEMHPRRRWKKVPKGRGEMGSVADRSVSMWDRSVWPSGPTRWAASWCLLVSSRSFFCRFRREINIFSSGTPNIANNMFVLIVSTSSSQWCTPIHHLRYFYMVKTWMSYKTSESTKTRGTCQFQTLQLCFVIHLVSFHAIVDG